MIFLNGLERLKLRKFYNNNSDVVIIGLQEFAPLNIMTVFLGPGEERLTRWEALINAHLARAYPQVKYGKFESHIMMGLCILVYGRKEVMNMVSEVRTAKTKTGFQGVGENKGSVIIR